MIILPRAHHVKEPLLALTLALHGVLLGLFDVGPGRAHLQTRHDRRQGAESAPLHCTRTLQPLLVRHPRRAPIISPNLRPA